MSHLFNFFGKFTTVQRYDIYIYIYILIDNCHTNSEVAVVVIFRQINSYMRKSQDRITVTEKVLMVVKGDGGGGRLALAIKQRWRSQACTQAQNIENGNLF